MCNCTKNVQVHKLRSRAAPRIWWRPRWAGLTAGGAPSFLVRTSSLIDQLRGEIIRGLSDVADLIVRGHSMDLAEIFWGDANPASNYMQGAISTQGRADDVMRLDAMAMFVFLGQ